MKNLLTTWKDNPIIVNELRSRMRGKRTFMVLMVHLLVLSGLVLTIYFSIYEQAQYYRGGYYGRGFQDVLEASAILGKSVFFGIVILLLFFTSLVGPAFTAGAIVTEKERQTYDLLAVTSLTSKEIVMGKLNAILVLMGLLILASLPFQTMAYFFGGVTIFEILIASVILILTTLLFCSMGLFVSSVARSTTVANMINYAAIIPLLLGVPLFLFLVGTLSSGFFFDWLFDDPPLFVAGVLTYIFLFLLSINPITMAVTSEIFLEETGNYFFSVEQVWDFYLPIVSPWVVYVIFCIVLSFFFIIATISRLSRVSGT